MLGFGCFTQKFVAQHLQTFDILEVFTCLRFHFLSLIL